MVALRSPAPPSQRGPRVLVVDDDADSREIYGLWLDSTGCRTSEATGGEECVRLVQEQQPDLVVLDMVMPEVDGWMAARRIRADPQTADVPILAVSGWVYPGDERDALAAGCDEFLRKPTTYAEFRARVDLLTARRGGDAAS